MSNIIDEIMNETEPLYHALKPRTYREGGFKRPIYFSTEVYLRVPEGCDRYVLLCMRSHVYGGMEKGETFGVFFPHENADPTVLQIRVEIEQVYGCESFVLKHAELDYN